MMPFPVSDCRLVLPGVQDAGRLRAAAVGAHVRRPVLAVEPVTGPAEVIRCAFGNYFFDAGVGDRPMSLRVATKLIAGDVGITGAWWLKPL